MIGIIDLSWLLTLFIPLLGGVWKIWNKINKKIDLLDNLANVINNANIPDMKVKIDTIEQSILTLCKDQSSIGMKLKFLFENETQAVFELDKDGKLFWANSSLLRLLELPDLETATGSEWLDALDPESAETVQRKIQNAIESHKSFYTRVKTRTGKDLNLNAYIMKDAAFSLAGWVCVLVAVSEAH